MRRKWTRARPASSSGSHNFAPADKKCEVKSRILQKGIPHRCRNDADPRPNRDPPRHRSGVVADIARKGGGNARSSIDDGLPSRTAESHRHRLRGAGEPTARSRACLCVTTRSVHPKHMRRRYVSRRRIHALPRHIGPTIRIGQFVAYRQLAPVRVNEGKSVASACGDIPAPISCADVRDRGPISTNGNVRRPGCAR